MIRRQQQEIVATGKMRKIAAIVGVLSAFAIGCPARPAAAQEPQTQVIEVRAKKYEYSPAPIHVKAGSKVQLKITATDHDHGFKVGTVPDGADKNGKPGLVFASGDDCVQLPKGQTTTVEFVAQTPGTYTFRCCKTCGLGHRGMKGQIVVDPA
jgi:heme/copper-type cytochrome/quinol oxidase subunit 2